MRINKKHAGIPRFGIIGVLVCVVILSLGYFNDPPNGYTGAPGDDLCTECHSLGTGMQNGSVILNGLPSTIIAEQTYTLSVTVSNPNGIADFAGFQSVILDANNANAGTLSNPSSGSILETQGARTYHEHAPAQMFPMSNAVTWTVNWEAPIGSGLITFYAAGNVANGNGNDNGDLILSTSVSGTLFTPLQVAITQITDVSCFGESDGSATALATFGEPPYQYNWSNGGSGSTITGLAAGSFTVTATDNDGTTATASAEVNQPPIFEIATETINHVSCNGGSDGSIVLVLDGGTPPYTGAQGDVYSLSNLDAGDYAVNIADANGCLISQDYTITEPPALNIEIQVIIEPDCFGDASGLITVEGMGGTGDIEYEWSNGGTTNTIQDLEAGEYSVSIIDENGCTAVETFVLNEPDVIEITLLQLEHVSCAGEADGSISVDAFGGTGGLTYQWSNGSTQPDISGLEAGDYSLTVTDANDCTQIANYIITEPAVLTAAISGTLSLLCFGDADGSLQVQAGGGTPGYAYQWSTGAITQSISGLIAGTYTVTVSDESQCTATATRTITQPLQLQPNATATGESAPGEMDGTATASPTGGTGGYHFLWSTNDTTATITGLAVGTYTVTVTDDSGCTAMQTVAVTGVDCTLLTNVTTTDALCSGEASGTAQVSVMGATGPIEVLWSNGAVTLAIADLSAGMYSVTVTDSAGCLVITDVLIGEPPVLASTCVATGETSDGANDGTVTCTPSGGIAPYTFLWSNGGITEMITGLAPGSYSVTITDANGCMHADTAIVNSFGCALQINITVVNALCFGESTGAASVAISGGTSPYEIIWSNGDTGMSIDSVVAGAYSLTVTDADDCVTELPFAIGQPDALIVTVDTVINGSQGNGGAIQITVTGGTAPYSTIWTLNGGLVSTNEDLTDLVPGDYALLVLDAHDCMLATGMLTVTVSTGSIDVPGAIAITLRPNPVAEYLLLDLSVMPSGWSGMIYSAEGKLIRSFDAGQLTGDKTLRIDTETLRAGMYYIRIAGTREQKVIPFVKM